MDFAAGVYLGYENLINHVRPAMSQLCLPAEVVCAAHAVTAALSCSDVHEQALQRRCAGSMLAMHKHNQ